MAKDLGGIDDPLRQWLEVQPIFFVSTAPRGDEGLLNCSPKGLQGSFRVLDEQTVAFLDLTGSGIETIAHLRENGRIVLMFCAFDGRPRIVRMHGIGRAILPESSEFSELIHLFSEHLGVRSIIRVAIRRTSESCGYGVPQMSYSADRDVLDLDHQKRGAAGLASYRAEVNRRSLDGLPALAT